MWFFGQNSPRCCQFCVKFLPVMTCKMMHQICYGFYWSSKKWSKLGHKTDFVAHFESFFIYVLLHCRSYFPSFCQMKGLIKIYIYGKFHHYSIRGCEVKIFQSFLCWFRIHECFLVPYSPKYCSILLKFWPEVVANKNNVVLEKSFKVLNFDSNGTHPKGAQFTTAKPKGLLKTNISATTSL